MKKLYNLIENDKFLVINKQPFVSTLLGDTSQYPILMDQIKIDKKENYHLVYPLESFLSGLLLASLNQDESKTLLNEGDIFVFDTIVYGKPLFKEPRLTKLLKLDLKGIKIDETGEPFSLNISVIEKYKDYSYLRVESNTFIGQGILFLLSYLGNPVVGDTVNGLKKKLFLSSIKGRKFKPNKDEEEKPLIKRPCLHLASFYSAKLNRTFQAPLTKDFRAVVNQLNKYNRHIEEQFLLQDILKNIVKQD